MYRIALHVENLDLEDVDVLAKISSVDPLVNLAWESTGGRVLAVLYCDDHEPTGQAIQVARRITHSFPEAKVTGVDPDLVSTSDIASRIGVNRETVRLWVRGDRGPGGFPESMGAVGGGDRNATRVWSWPFVNAWLEKHFHLGDGDEYLTPQQVARLNSALLQVEDDLVDLEWKELVQLDLPFSVVPQPTAGETPSVTPESDFIPAVNVRVGVRR